MYKTAVYTCINGCAVTKTSKTAKIIKRWYYSTAHWELVDVMVANITFRWFCCFRCVSHCITINACINCSFFTFICINSTRIASAEFKRKPSISFRTALHYTLFVVDNFNKNYHIYESLFVRQWQQYNND